MDIKGWRPYEINFYDFFGYLLPGFFLVGLFIFEYDVGDLMEYYTENNNTFRNLSGNDIESKLDYLLQFLSWNSEGDFKFTTLFLFIIYCYLLGHILAAIGSIIYEKFIVANFLKYPSENLFGKNPFDGQGRWIRFREWLRPKAQFIFNKFCQPLNERYAEDLEKLIQKRFGPNVNRSNYFWLCFTDISKYSPVAYIRVMRFLNLYAFSRNLSVGLLIYLPTRLFFYAFLGSTINIYNCIILTFYIFLAAVLFWNYLKLFRRQTQELYFHFYTLHRDELIKENMPQYHSNQTRT